MSLWMELVRGGLCWPQTGPPTAKHASSATTERPRYFMGQPPRLLRWLNSPQLCGSARCLVLLLFGPEDTKNPVPQALFLGGRLGRPACSGRGFSRARLVARQERGLD